MLLKIILEDAGSKSPPPRIWDDFWVLQEWFTVGFTAWAKVAKALLVSGPEANSPPAKPEDGWAKLEALHFFAGGRCQFHNFTIEP